MVMEEVVKEVLGKAKDRSEVGGVVQNRECPSHFQWSYQVSQVAATLETMKTSPIVVPEPPSSIYNSITHPTTT